MRPPVAGGPRTVEALTAEAAIGERAMGTADEPVAASADDAALVRRVCAGETDAYAQLVERYQERAVRLAFGLVHHWEDARDISQDAFVKAYQRLDAFREEAAFSTWFYRIVVNACRDFQRRRRVRAWVSLDATSEEADGEDRSLFEPPSHDALPDAQAADRELGAALTRAIDQLPDRQRTAFILKHLEGLSIEETAGVLQCASGTVKAHLFHAAAHLQRALRSAGYTEHVHD